MVLAIHGAYRAHGVTRGLAKFRKHFKEDEQLIAWYGPHTDADADRDAQTH